MGYVFISYSTKNQDAADAMRNLFNKKGINTWMAPYNIPAGSEYAEVLYDALERCSCMLLLLTESSQSSQWVRKEVNIAVSNGKTVIPVMLENIELNSSMKLYLNDQQIIPVRVLDEGSDEIQRVVSSVSVLVGNNDDVGPVLDTKVVDTPAYTPAKNSGNAAVEKKKGGKAWIFAVIGAVLVAVIVVLVILLMGGKGGGGDNSGTGNSAEDSTAENVSVEFSDGFSSVDDTLVLGDSLFDFTFELGGTVYKLPCTYTDLADDGWSIAETGMDGNSVMAGSAAESLRMANKGEKVLVTVYNPSGNSKKISECYIVSVINNDTSSTSLVLPKNVTVGATVDSIKDAYGTPNDTHSGSGYERLTYVKDQMAYAEFCVYNDGGLEIRYFNANVSVEGTETNTERPDYLDSYVKPTTIGTDLFAGVFKLEGDLYSLSCPVSEFLNNGWSVISGPGSIVSGGKDTLRVEKNGKKMYLDIQNFADYQTTSENCVVYRVEASTDNGIDISLPTQAGTLIKVGTDKATFEGLAGDAFSFYDGNTAYYYSYTDKEGRDFELSIRIDADTDLIESIKIKCIG